MDHDIDTAQLTELSTRALSTATGGIYNAPASFSGPFTNFICRRRTGDKLECKWQSLGGQDLSPVYRFSSKDDLKW